MTRILQSGAVAVVLLLGSSLSMTAQEFAPDQVIVNGATQSQLAVTGGSVVRAIAALGHGGDRLVTLRPGLNPRLAAAMLARLPDVKYACPNYVRQASVTPSDPEYSHQWGWPRIEAPYAWDLCLGDKSIDVGILDTGVALDHPDLAANIWINQAEASGHPGVDDDGNGFIDDISGWNAITETPYPVDDNGHGSHCAGIIGAEANNRTGGCGASWIVRMMALKFLDASGRGYDADAIALIDYVIATNRAGSSNVRILSNSWGGYGHSPALQAAIERARDAGIVFVAAAGNESFDLDSSGCGHAPAGLSVSNIVTVSATDGRDRLAFFSNYASSLSALGAPGVNIYSCDLNKGHAMRSGTSMACPHVAGILALTAAANPDLDTRGLVDQLLLNVDPVLSLDRRTSTRGRLNAYRAVANDPNPAYDPDRDHDGIVNHQDNCPDSANTDQGDSDNNGVGDACPGPNTPCPLPGCLGAVTH